GAGHTLWASKRDAPGVSSPVAWKGLLFSVSSSSILCCREVASGNELWRQRLEGRFLASLVAGDDQVYALNADGVMFVVPATRERNPVVRNAFDEPCTASPAVANGRLFVRTAQYLYCVGDR